MKRFLNDTQRTALLSELRELSRLFAATAVLGALSSVLSATLGSLLLSTSIFITFCCLYVLNDLKEVVIELKEFRKYVLSGMLLAYATAGLSFNLGFYIIAFMALLTVVAEMALLDDH